MLRLAKPLGENNQRFRSAKVSHANVVVMKRINVDSKKTKQNKIM